jgi:protoheme IX farnesyltransferase
LVALFAFALIVTTGLDYRANDAPCASISECFGWTGPGATNLPRASHLLASALTGAGALALAALTRPRALADARIDGAIPIACVLAAVQFALVATPAGLIQRGWLEAARVGTTALVLALVIYLATALGRVNARPMPVGRTRSGQPLVALAIAGVFLVLVSGAYLTPSGSGADCSGWPICSPVAADAQLVHRAAVLLSGCALLAMLVVAPRSGASAGRAPSLLALPAVFGAEIAIGALSALGGSSEAIAAAHFAVAGIAWSLLIATAVTMWGGAPAVATQAPSFVASGLLRDYVRVTKPGIMLLLLTTTLGAMLAAGSNWPSTGLVLATLAGGALASGGASALNCYLDRDIDAIMARTRRRPLPTGRLTPQQVRTFGLILSVLAVLELALLVNPVAAALALVGNLFYVVVYTRYLKRATPQNIVIGGAAGSFPPLVGWAAVTGSVTLPALVLFAIIFVWTPPHFWSLALLKARDYERAGIPMLPVTHGAAYTRRMILLYALLLVAVTALLVPAGGAGWLYLTSAALLGVVFVALAARMYREGTERLAWPLFKYSNYYLALVLAAMVLDRALTR